MLTILFMEFKYCFNNLFSLSTVIILIFNDEFLILKNEFYFSKNMNLISMSEYMVPDSPKGALAW